MDLKHAPEVAQVPAPWVLTGDALIVAVRLPASFTDRDAFVPDGLVGGQGGRLGYLMFVDYTDSNVGPYRELLFVPGRLEFPDGKRRLSISRIFVSTWESVVNGQRNWGIPKDRADFDVTTHERGTDRVSMTVDGETIAQLAFRARGPAVPFRGAWLPETLRTFGQLHEGATYLYAPVASGRVRSAQLESWSFDAAQFPDLGKGRVISAVKLERFEVHFPVAQVSRPAPSP